jgi:hypothetical protein
LLFESPSGRGSIVSKKNGSLTVIVILECGGTFHKGLTKELVEPDGRIKSATIAPWLKFKFEKLGDSRKTTTTIVTQCNLGGGQLKYHEDLDLGYYHDNITISHVGGESSCKTFIWSSDFDRPYQKFNDRNIHRFKIYCKPDVRSS